MSHDSLKYHLQNLEKEIDAERASFAAKTAELQKSVDLGIIRKDFKELKHSRLAFGDFSSSYRYSSSDGPIGVKVGEREFRFDDDKFLENVIAHVDSLLKEDESAIAHNEAINAHNSGVISKINVLIANCGFSKEKRVKIKSRSWIQKYATEHLNIGSVLSGFYEHAPTYSIKDKKDSVVRYASEKLNAHTAAKEKKEQEKKAKALADPLLAEAIAYLASNGKKLGEDFSPETAVEDANTLAFELEVESLKKIGGPFEFDGDDNCENCIGWDGEERRCHCGNRRVSWERDWSHSFKSPSVRGVAY